MPLPLRCPAVCKAGHEPSDEGTCCVRCKEGTFKPHLPLQLSTCFFATAALNMCFVLSAGTVFMCMQTVLQFARRGMSHQMKELVSGARKAPSRPIRVTKSVRHVPGQRSLRKLEASLQTHVVSQRALPTFQEFMALCCSVKADAASAEGFSFQQRCMEGVPPPTVSQGWVRWCCAELCCDVLMSRYAVLCCAVCPAGSGRGTDCEECPEHTAFLEDGTCKSMYNSSCHTVTVTA